MSGKFTTAEILSQPQAWQNALEYLNANSRQLDQFRDGSVDEVIFTGCGSTMYLSLAAAALFQELTGLRARGVPASELWLYPGGSITRRGSTLLVAVSRSGTTTETLRAVQRFRECEDGGRVLTLSCYPEGELAELGDVNLVLEAGQERSVAQTRAFSVLYLSTVYLAHRWAELDPAPLHALPSAAAQLTADLPAKVVKLANDSSLDRFYFLGSGPRYGLAAELSLKMKEMSLSHSEPFHFLEFRHGPQSMVTKGTLLVGLVSEVNEASEQLLLEEMRQRGAETLSVGPLDCDVSISGEIPESARNVLYLPPLQRLALARAQANELDPDRPHNLTSVVTLS